LFIALEERGARAAAAAGGRRRRLIGGGAPQAIGATRGALITQSSLRPECNNQNGEGARRQ
jgi:hypothetical protein